MNRQDEYLEGLGARARRDPAPETNVSARVLSQLAEAGPPEAFSPITVFAVASVAVASVAVALAGYALYSALDPFEAFLRVTPVLMG